MTGAAWEARRSGVSVWGARPGGPRAYPPRGETPPRRPRGARRPGGPAGWLRPFAPLLAALGWASPATAQTLVGRVLEEGREVPVSGAVVMLLDAGGEERTSAIADSLGRYRLGPPEAGEYVVRAVRIGYQASTSPLLAMGTEGEAGFDLLLTPLPLGLEGFEVTVERPPEEMAELLLRPLGLDAEELDERWISREEIDDLDVPGGAVELIQWAAIPGVRVELAAGIPFCVSHQRGRTGAGLTRCALTVLDGGVVPPSTIELIGHLEIEGIAVLDPTRATTLYGTRGGGGAVLVWTRRGAPR